MERSTHRVDDLDPDSCEDENDDLDETGAEIGLEICSSAGSTPKARRPAPASPAGSVSPAASPSGQPHGASGLRLPAIATRASSTGSLVRGGFTRARLTLTAVSKFEGAELSVELAEGELERGSAGLPTSLGEGETATVEFRGSGPIVGTLRVGGSPPVPFGVQVAVPHTSASGSSSGLGLRGERLNFVSAPHRQRSVIAHADGLEFSNGMSATGEGVVADVSISADFNAEMLVVMRRATRKELTRLAQQQALLDAMEKKRYSSLLAQITRSKMRKVDSTLIEQASRLLKTIKLPEGSFLTHRELGKLMRWKRVTSPHDGCEDLLEPCGASGSCPCNEECAQEGELCDVLSGTVHQALDGVAPAHVPADKWLFHALVHAAMHAPEGCVWKAGGKFLLSNEERNQSPSAIVNVLERDNQESDAGKGIRALVAYTEREYHFRVTAIQLNFHPNNKSSHKQHRDIYGAGQKGGINCTCSFMKCTGTVCYSLGSSRQIQCETITDQRSKYEACGEDCTGAKTFKWMHSGSAMYFNAPWNNNHTHGVPRLEEACGPRISVALLCA